MARHRTDYFKLLEQQAEFSLQASELLLEILTHYSPDKISQQQFQMHNIEHKADDLHHDIVTKLSKVFITPIDHEDILRLVQTIDDVTDALDQVTRNMYMFHVNNITKEISTLAEKVNKCVKTFKEAITELKNFKKPEKLRQLLVEVNTIESEADAIYIEAIHRMFSPDNDVKNIIGMKAVYDSLESCFDLCEDASDIIEQIIMKNL